MGKKVEKKPEISKKEKKEKERKKTKATASFTVPLSHRRVADVNRKKQCSLPITSQLAVSRITTAGALFWLLGAHGSRDL